MAGSPCPMEVMKKVVDVMGASEIPMPTGDRVEPGHNPDARKDPLELRVSTVGQALQGPRCA